MITKFVESEFEHVHYNKVFSYILEGVNGYVAGGVFKDIYQNKPVRDIDIFFETEVDFLVAYEKFSTRKRDFNKVYENSNATCFKCFKHNVMFEIISKVFCKPEKMLDEFDFTICKSALTLYRSSFTHLDKTYNFIDFKLIQHKDFVKDLNDKKLVFDENFKTTSLKRYTKYLKYGFLMSSENKDILKKYLKTCKTVDKIDATYISDELSEEDKKEFEFFLGDVKAYKAERRDIRREIISFDEYFN